MNTCVVCGIMVQMVIFVCVLDCCCHNATSYTGININFLDVTKCSLCKTYELCSSELSFFLRFSSFLENEMRRSCLHRHSTHTRSKLMAQFLRCSVHFATFFPSVLTNQLSWFMLPVFFAIYMGEIEFGGVVLGMYSFNKSRNRRISLPAAVKSPWSDSSRSRNRLISLWHVWNQN